MLTSRATLRRAIGTAFVAAVVALPAAAPAAAEEDVENPKVGGDALYATGLTVASATAAMPAAAARSFVVADLDTGEILAAQNAHEALPPASTLKMLTALTVLPRVGLDEVYTAVHEDAAVEGSKVGIVPGSTYTARQLFEGVFLISGNDAAHAVANLNGGVAGTVDQMQAEASRVQAYDTVVRNPHGLDAAGQVSSAYDLALIAREGMKRDDFAAFAGLSNSTFPMTGTEDPLTRPTFEIWNQNNLVTGAYDGGIGVKSGFTTNAGRTFAAAAERDGKRYLVTLMGIAGNTYQTGEDYLDWAFANGGSVEPVGTLVAPKFDTSQSDAAALEPQESEPAAAGLPALPIARPSRLPMYLTGASVASILVIWWQLRSSYRRGLRRKQSGPGSEPGFVDLRDRDRVRI